MDQADRDRSWAARQWETADGLKLHYRDYPGREDRPPVLCLHGLTRNARDFAELASRIAGEWRVIVPDYRGRGESDYAPDGSSYTPAQYFVDLEELLAQQGIDRFVSIGTSLGGLLTMLLAHAKPDRIAGALLNDIGPELEPEGVKRIGGYVGQSRNFSTWMHAARAIAETQGPAFPDYEIEDWLAMAKRNMSVGQNGRITFDYDMAIADNFAGDTEPAQVTMWDQFAALAGRPVTLLRGGLSDLLSERIVAEMQARVPEMEAVTVPRVGHAPMLSEPESLAAIDRLLARVAAA